MARPEAKCGTDAGYYRHRRKKNEEACAECRTAHSIATRRDRSQPRPPKPQCACGRNMHPGRERCSHCTRAATSKIADSPAYTYSDDEMDPKRPADWVRKGLVWWPVYEQSEVA